MTLIPVLKNFLFVLLLSLIPSSALLAAETPQVYRFGGWTVIAPAELSPEVLRAGPHTMRLPLGGLELLAYWQDGSQRAVAIRFSGEDPAQDVVVMKSYRRSNRLKDCGFGAAARIKPLKKTRPAEVEAVNFPDDASLLLGNTERGLRREGDLLVADLAGARVQLQEDSPTVRLGQWDSAEFCRYELIEANKDDED